MPLPRVRRVAAVVAAGCLLVSCSGEPAADQAPGSDPSPRATATAPQASPDEPTTDTLPDVPAYGRPAALAAQLDQSLTILRDRSASADALRRAGELQQLAARNLARSGPAAERAVTTRLSRQDAALVGAAVRAARQLDALTEPQPKFPDWQIVRPAPAGTLLRHYQAAQREFGVPWSHLAAINLVETRMGRIRGVSSAGARGPMQFLPTTWTMYGAGGDITDPRDAIFAAARLLKANGAPGDMAEALWHYNPSDNYVRAVSEYAASLQRAPWLYRGYWQWRVLYKHVRGTHDLPIGYPESRPQLVPER